MRYKNKLVPILIFTGIPAVVLLYFYITGSELKVEPDNIVTIEQIRTSTEDNIQDSQDLQNIDVTLFFELKDFSCPTCIKNFLHFSDYVNENFDKWQHRALFVTSRNKIPLAMQKKRLEAWAEANYIDPTIILISKDFKDNHNLKKSCILVSSGHNQYEVFYLPLTPSKQYYIEKKMNM